MKTASLFQLGGLAVVLSAIVAGVANMMYFLSGQPTAPTTSSLWLAIATDSLLMIGLGALFARQAERAGMLGVIGYVLLVAASLYYVGSEAVGLGIAAGAITSEQIAQVAAYTVLNSIMPWAWVVGLVAFGIATYRAHVFPKYAGVLLVLVGILQPLTGPLDFARPIYAVVSFAAWAWLGWTLTAGKNVVAGQPVLATN